ncbi:MAG: hypothetical protein EGQ56_07965 [Clostridiales bacterium]|nr:hypothetical protein [Clostridiales bacterium]
MANSTYATSVERLESASAAWLRDLGEQGRLSRTVEAYASTLADFTSFFGADEDKSDIPSYAEVLLWRGNLESRGCKERTIAQYLRQLRAFFDWACEHGWYQANPVLKRLIPSVSDLPPAEYVALHDWQLQRLYTFNRPQNAKATTYPRNYAIVIMLLTTDLRNGELLHLTPADLHWSDNVIAARDGHTGEVRQVAFSDLAQSAVRIYLASGIRPQDLPDTAPLFGNTAPKGSFGPRASDESREWQHGSRQWLSALVESHVKAVAFTPSVRCEELRHAAAQAESASLAEIRARQARRNVRLLEQMKSRP